MVFLDDIKSHIEEINVGSRNYSESEPLYYNRKPLDNIIRIFIEHFSDLFLKLDP